MRFQRTSSARYSSSAYSLAVSSTDLPGFTAAQAKTLAEAESLPTGRYDCVILTQVLQFLSPRRRWPTSGRRSPPVGS